MNKEEKLLISLIYKKLNNLEIFCHKPRASIKKGYVDKRGVRWNGTIYRLSITRKADLLKFIQAIKPYIKHAKRTNDLLKAEVNIIERNKRV